jgi:uncharacterized protein (TIGR03437 family)
VKRLAVWCVLTGAVSAAPVLRLSNSVVTVEAPLGGTPNNQFVSWSNAGDGTLSLSFSISPTVSWLAVSAAGPTGCSSCIQFTFNTANLQAGNYTARVTVSDPNAVDSPQVVIVTAFIGGWPPLAVDQYVAPGTTVNIPLRNDALCFPPTSCSGVVTTADGGKWLSLIVASEGTLQYFQSIGLQPPAGMAPGTYTGNVAIGPPIGENIPVTMRLTTLPIAVPSTAQISLQLAQNGPATTYPFLPFISLSNSGMGTLQVTGVSGSGTGVSAYDYNGLAIVTVDPTGLAPGNYSDGMVTIQCNGANCPVQVPVSVEVDPQGPPIVTYQGVVDNATFSPTGSPGDVMVVKGSQLSFEAPQTASGTPLPTTLGGASVLVNGVATPLYYSSFGQIAFQARADTYLGTALVQVIRDGQIGNTVSVNMAQYAPGIVVVTDSSYNLVDATHPAHAGETLVFWALGLGATSPVVADGVAAPSPPAIVTAPVSVQFGLEFFLNTTTPGFVGLSPGSVGLYQVSAALPASTPVGTVSASLLVAGVKSNLVVIAVE